MRPVPTSDENLSGYVYGEIIATSTVAALALDEDTDALELLLSLVATMLVFWVAHGYAEATSRRLRADTHRPALAELREVLRHEWSIVAAAGPLIVPLALGALHVLGRDLAVDLAIGVGVVSLAAWGIVIGRRTGRSPLQTAGICLINGALGLLIVGLKVLIH